MSVAPVRLLTFDYGLRRTGLAAGQTLTGTAAPLPPIAMVNGQPDWDEMSALLNRWKPDGLLVGLPLNMDGTASDMTLRADKFRKRLHGRFGLPALGWDERLTSHEVKQTARESGITDFGVHSVDSDAAVLIFQSWYEALPADKPWQLHSLDW